MMASFQPQDTANDSLSEAIARDGYVFLKRWRTTIPSEAIVNSIGRPLKFGRANAVHDLIPKQETTKNSYSGIYGLSAFPFHSDMAHWPQPPRYLMLRCVRGHKQVETILADGIDIVASDTERKLGRALVKPRRALNGVLPLFSLYRPMRHTHPALLRWDEEFIIPASPVGEEGMRLIKATLFSVRTTSISLCEPGDTLFIDNWRMLHARSVVTADQTDRVIERAYLGALH